MEINLDNSAFSLLSCEYKFQKVVIEGLTSSNPSTEFGDVVHKALEYQDHGLTRIEVIDKLSKNCPNTDIPKALTLLTFFNATVKLPPPIMLLDNRPALEVKFKHKYVQHIIPGSSELLTVNLVGTIDRLYIDNDTLVIADYKTTAAATAYAIEKVERSYALAFQLPFYFYCLLNFFDGMLPAGYKDYLINHKYRMEIILLCHNTNPPTFRKYIRPPFNDDTILREIPMIINHKINSALAIAALTSQAPKTGFTVYGACDNCNLRPACLSSGTALEADIISSYERKPYNPLSFR